jgi:hypothetical protein
MELKDYIIVQLESSKRMLNRVLDTLKQSELGWRPACGCNSIGLIFFHVIRSEDSFIQARLQNKPEIWETGKWSDKMKLPATEAGAHYTVDQVNAFPVPELKDLMAYFEAVRQSTLDYVKTADFDKKITLPRFGEMTVGAFMNLVTSHTSQHLGEMSYIRGIERGMDK